MAKLVTSPPTRWAALVSSTILTTTELSRPEWRRAKSSDDQREPAERRALQKRPDTEHAVWTVGRASA
jgi:hypothetical protein